MKKSRFTKMRNRIDEEKNYRRVAIEQHRWQYNAWFTVRRCAFRCCVFNTIFLNISTLHFCIFAFLYFCISVLLYFIISLFLQFSTFTLLFCSIFAFCIYRFLYFNFPSEFPSLDFFILIFSHSALRLWN